MYIVAGPEFGELEGHVLIIQKALYGLKSSGLRWHERFADVLRGVGFELGIPNVGTPNFEIIEFGNEGQDSYSAE